MSHRYKFKSGVTVDLKPLPIMMQSRLAAMADDMPDPPMKPMREIPAYKGALGGDSDQLAPDESDPGYLAEVARVNGKQIEQMFKMFAVMCVKNDVPDEEVANFAFVFNLDAEKDKLAIKHQWVQSLIADDVELADFVENLMSISLPTPQAMEEAASPDRFRSDGEQPPSDKTQDQKSA